MTKLLVISGVETNTVEVINLDPKNPDLVCDNLPNLPNLAYVSGGMGALYGGKTPIFCGGFRRSSGKNFVNKKFITRLYLY